MNGESVETGRPAVGGYRRWLGRVARRTADGGALLWFSARLTLGKQAWALAVMAVGVFAYAALTNAAALTPTVVFRIVLYMEVAFFVLLSMGLLAREKETKTFEVLLACVPSPHMLVVIKFAPVCLFVGVVALGLSWGFHWVSGGGFSWAKMAVISFALAATMGMLTVVVSTYVRNQYAAGAIALVLAVGITTVWLDPTNSLYGAPTGPTMRQASGPRDGRGGESQSTGDRRSDRRGGGGGPHGGDHGGPGGGPPGRSAEIGGASFSPSAPNLWLNRVLLAFAFGFLYDHAVRRLAKLDLWVR